MRVRLIILLFTGLFVWTAISPSAAADTICLKNGRKIWADSVHENGPRVEYEVGENSFAVSKASVDHIEAGGMPPEFGGSASSSKSSHDIPTFSPADNLANQSQLYEKVVRNGQIDLDALSSFEQGDQHTAAVAYFVAGKYEFERGNFPKARGYFDSALRYDGENPTILNYYAALLIRTGSPSEALSYAEHAVRIAPESPDALDVLGYAQYAADKTQNAIATWKHSLQLRPDASIQQMIEKAQRDVTAEANFSENESSHFTLRYEGKQTTDSFRRQLIGVLESDYDDLVRQLGVAPRNTISVILYTDQAFFDVTRAPSWTGALNDGKLRIPVNGLTSVNSDLAHVLKHELAHSFINNISAGRCPPWLHEGIAQAMEPKSLSYGHQLATLFANQQEIPFNALEGSFMRFSGAEAVLAYEESLAAANYIIDTYGASDLQRILERLGQGSSTEAALRATIHADYRDFEGEVGKYLTDKYGK